MPSNILIYGSNGYTGELIVRLALGAGLGPVLAGRDRGKIEAQAAKCGLNCVVFDLNDPKAVDDGLRDTAVVIHCAGPFSRTARQIADGCIRTKTHYLDITGEIEVFEMLARMGKEAEAAGVMLMPGAGFDVVPSDCLAAHLKRRLPDAAELTLAIKAIGRPSRGTATTMIENIHKGGMVRRDGKLTPVPAAWKTRDVDFGEGPASCMTIPWGDVSTAYYSTGIPNITVYMAIPPDFRRMAVLSRYFGWLMGPGPVQNLLKRQIQKQPPGPTDEQRASSYSLLWGEAKNGGKAIVSRMRTPEGYTLTARTALEIARRAAAGQFQPGFRTPSMVFGPDFILEFEGVERTDL
jgi:short subunit dehydrogenase-like uncharacterized protein